MKWIVKKVSKKHLLKELKHYRKEVEIIKQMNNPKNILKEIHNTLGF